MSEYEKKMPYLEDIAEKVKKLEKLEQTELLTFLYRKYNVPYSIADDTHTIVRLDQIDIDELKKIILYLQSFSK